LLALPPLDVQHLALPSVHLFELPLLPADLGRAPGRLPRAGGLAGRKRHSGKEQQRDTPASHDHSPDGIACRSDMGGVAEAANAGAQQLPVSGGPAHDTEFMLVKASVRPGGPK
jgi:hypothetical protein